MTRGSCPPPRPVHTAGPSHRPERLHLSPDSTLPLSLSLSSPGVPTLTLRGLAQAWPQPLRHAPHPPPLSLASCPCLLGAAGAPPIATPGSLGVFCMTPCIPRCPAPPSAPRPAQRAEAIFPCPQWPRSSLLRAGPDSRARGSGGLVLGPLASPLQLTQSSCLQSPRKMVFTLGLHPLLPPGSPRYPEATVPGEYCHLLQAQPLCLRPLDTVLVARCAPTPTPHPGRKVGGDSAGSPQAPGPGDSEPVHPSS